MVYHGTQLLLLVGPIHKQIDEQIGFCQLIEKHLSANGITIKKYKIEQLTLDSYHDFTRLDSFTSYTTDG